MRTLFIIFVLALTTYAYSQKKNPAPKNEPAPLQNSEYDRMMSEALEMRQKMLKEMHEAFMDEQMGGPSLLDRIFEEEGLDALSSGSWGGGSSSTGLFSSKWEENDKERIFVIKPVKKEVPLDIKINKQMLTISAKQVEKDQSGSSRSFNSSSSFSLPSDVDGDKAQIEQRGEEILVRLPRRAHSGENKGNVKPKKMDDGTKPLSPSPGDITI